MFILSHDLYLLVALYYGMLWRYNYAVKVIIVVNFAVHYDVWVYLSKATSPGLSQ